MEGEVGRLFCSVIWGKLQEQQSPYVVVRALFCMVRHQESNRITIDLKINDLR